MGEVEPYVKDAIGHFRNLLEHAMREHEPTSEHVLKRLLIPLCRDISLVVSKGTSGDASSVLEGFRVLCTKAIKSMS
ncbi:MAG: hypothetical protein QXV46_05195 [Candidatus Bathyarchaeia archaeon]